MRWCSVASGLGCLRNGHWGDFGSLGLRGPVCLRLRLPSGGWANTSGTGPTVIVGLPWGGGGGFGGLSSQPWRALPVTPPKKKHTHRKSKICVKLKVEHISKPGSKACGNERRKHVNHMNKNNHSTISCQIRISWRIRCEHETRRGKKNITV